MRSLFIGLAVMAGIAAPGVGCGFLGYYLWGSNGGWLLFLAPYGLFTLVGLAIAIGEAWSDWN